MKNTMARTDLKRRELTYHHYGKYYKASNSKFKKTKRLVFEWFYTSIHNKSSNHATVDLFTYALLCSD